ncbi:MAG: hypothetical protein J5710_14135 [Treponema sp.]|nr:hypothetical protein [Treponema sp.]
MDKFLIRKDVYGELIEKGYGKKDLSKLTKKKITDKNGHTRTVYVRNGEQPATQQQPKARDELSPEKKARYEEMLEQVKAGPEENALFVRGKGMLNKKDAITHLEGKLGKKSSSSLREQTPSIREKEESLSVNEADKFYGNYGLKKVGESVDRKGWTVKEYKNNAGETWIGKFNKEGKYVGSEYNPVGAKKNSAAQGHLESDTPQNTDITKEDEERFGKQALSGLSGKRTSSEEKKTPKLGLQVGDIAFTKYGERAEIVEVDGEWVTAKMNGRTEKYKENAFKGKVEKKPTQDDMKENYLDVKNETGKDIAENNKIENTSETIKFSPEEMKVIKTVAEKINYQPGDEGYLLNTIYSENKDVYSALTKKNKEAWDKSGKKQKTFSSTDLLKEKIKSMNGNFGADDTNKISFEDSVKEYNFTDTKKGQFAMNEVANFYPELKDIVENRRKAFYEVDAAEKKLKVNPNNKEYKDNFASAYNKLKQADAEYDKASKKALEKAPNIKKPDFYKYMDAKRDVQKFLDKYKMQSEEYEVGRRLRENGGASILSPMYGLKPDDYTKDPDYIKAQMIIRAYEQK